MIPLWLDIAVKFAAVIGAVIGVISFIRTIYINKRLNDEPYFKNILGLVENELFPQIREIAQHSAAVNERINKDMGDIFNAPELLPRVGDTLERIKNFLANYTLKYDRKFQRSASQIYNNGVRLRNAIENSNELIYPLTPHFAMVLAIGRLDNQTRKSVEKIVPKYFQKKPTRVSVEGGEKGDELTEKIVQEYFRENAKDVTLKEFAQALKNNKGYVKDVEKIRGEILTLTSSIEKDAKRFGEKLKFYLLRFGSSPNTA